MLGTTVAATAAALLSALPAVAGSRAIIQNYCGFDVYSWSVDTETNPSEPTVIKSHGGVYNEDCRVPGSGGVSIKLALENHLNCPQTQLEYTIDSTVWYDVSNVDCVGSDCPFQPYGLYLHSGNDCPVVSCIPGNETCHGAYTLWDDNWASLSCQADDANVYLYLCTDSADPPANGPPPPVHHHHKKPAPIPSSPIYSSSAVPAVAGLAHHAPKEPMKEHFKEPKVQPTSTVDPATEYVEVTHVMTKVVTVTPTHTKVVHARHIHDHMQAHAHHH